MRKLLSLSFLLIFSVSAHLFAEQAPVQKKTELTSFLKKLPQSSYRKVYSGEESIGKTESSWKTMPNGELEFSERSSMKITLFNKTQNIETSIVARTNPQLEIQDFTYEMKSDDSKMKVEAKRAGHKMSLKKTQAGHEQITEVLIQEPLLVLPLIRPYMIREGLLTSKGALQRNASLLEPVALTTIPVSLSSKPEASGYSLKTTYLNQVLLSRLDAQGELIEEKTDFAQIPLVERKVSREEFESTELAGMKADLVQRVKVQFPRLKQPQMMKEFEVRLSGISLNQFQLLRHRQSLDGDVLKITKEVSFDSAPIQSLVGRKEFDKYLAAEVSIPVFEPLIQRQAREIVVKENDLWKRAKAIHQFVYKHLKKDPYISLPDAIEALESGKGDCNEHAVLYTALARAAGVPTRTVVGLVYSESVDTTKPPSDPANQPGFYYHAWVEVYTGKTWVAIDPTWNQIPADVTHIAFIEGGADQQIQMASIMGRIKLTPVGTAAVR